MQNSTEKYLIGRQPILDRNQELFAYELLFRSTKSLNKALFHFVWVSVFHYCSSSTFFKHNIL